MKRIIIISAIILTPIALVVLYLLLLNSRPGKPGPLPEHTEQELRVGALNIAWLGFNKDARTTASVLAESAVENALDVILLQEYREHWQFDEKEFAAVFKKDYKYVSIEGECACISKYPITSHKRVKFEDFSDSFSDILISVPGKRTVEIFAVHLMSTGLNNFTDGRIPEDVAGVGAIGTFLGNSDIRNNQAVSLSRRVERTLNPLIIAGDFNCVPYGTPYRKMTSVSMKDSFLEVGHGPGATYRRMGNLFRIDYIFHNSDLECIDSRIIDDEISDHKMVVSSFVFSTEVE